MRLLKHALAGISLVALGIVSCDHPTTSPAPGLSLDVVSGDGQTGIVGTQLAPLIVKVTNAGNPVAGQVLNFRVVAGGGSVYGGTELTDGHGIAQELWTLGTKAGDPQEVEVRAVESNTGAEKVFGSFTATAIAGPATLMQGAAGDGETTGVGSPLAIAPTVLVTDRYGNPVAGSSIGFAVTSGGGSLTGSTATTGANGTAAVGSWTLGATAGINTLTATSVGLTGSPLTFTATAIGPAGLTITNFAGDGQIAAPGGVLPIAPTVRVTDQNAHPVSGVVVAFAVTAGGGGITGGSQVTDANGLATVGSWTLGNAPGVNELKASFNTGVSHEATIFVATVVPVNSWIIKAPMPTGRSWLGVDVASGLLLAVGGVNNSGFLGTLEAFDPSTNSWVGEAPMPTPRHRLAVGVVNDVLYAVGGVSTSSPFNTVEAYDPRTNTWTTKAPMPTPRYDLAVGVVGTILYAVGGTLGNSQIVATVEAYDATTDSWTSKAPLPAPRTRLAVKAMNGVLYAIGGDAVTSSGSSPSGTVYAYDPTTDTWTTRAPMPSARESLGVGATNGVIYAVGGFAAGGVLGTNEVYDPRTDNWATVAPMPTARAEFGLGVLNGLLYAVGGDSRLPTVAINEAYEP